MATTQTPDTAARDASDQLLAVLEPDQLTGARRVKLPRRYLKGPQLVIIWTLRLYLLFMIAVVVYQIFTGAR